MFVSSFEGNVQVGTNKVGLFQVGRKCLFQVLKIAERMVAAVGHPSKVFSIIWTKFLFQFLNEMFYCLGGGAYGSIAFPGVAVINEINFN